MNRLSLAQQVRVISLLTESVSVRAVERLTGVHRDTIIRLSNTVGTACGRLHDARMRNLHVSYLQVDETWSFIGMRQKNLKPDSPPQYGDCYTWIALDADRRAVVSYRVGKRYLEDAKAFVADLRGRVLNRPQITSDGYVAYIAAVEEAFGTEVDYAAYRKQTAELDSPVFGISKVVHQGDPDMDKVSTSLVERLNLSVRMHLRRCSRRTSGHSKRFANHKAALDLMFAAYNWTRPHETLKITPCMELGLTDHIWSIAELIREALATPLDVPPLDTPGPVPRPGRRPFKLHVISGGKVN